MTGGRDHRRGFLPQVVPKQEKGNADLTLHILGNGKVHSPDPEKLPDAVVDVMAEHMDPSRPSRPADGVAAGGHAELAI